MLDLDRALDQLAPHVDVDASRALFEQRRSADDESPTAGGARRAVLVTIAAMVVLVLGITAIVVAAGTDATLDTADTDGATSVPETAPAPSTTMHPPVTEPTSQPDVLLLSAMGVRPAGSRIVALNEDEYAEIWQSIGGRPDLDLDRWVVATVKVPSTLCGPTQMSLSRSGSTVTPVFAQGDCGLSQMELEYIFAIRRDLVVPAFTLEFEGVRTDVTVPAATPTPTTPEPPTPAGALGVVPLPRVGTSRSAVLDNGLPVWVVQHADGTVSVVPAVAPDHDEPIELPAPDGSMVARPEVAGLWSFVQTNDRGFAVPGQVWDLHGRAQGDDRSRDLVGWHGEVGGEWVVVTASTDPIPGGFDGDSESSPFRWRTPRTPEPELAPGALTTGWHALADTILVGSGDQMKLCPAPPNGVSPEDTFATCAGPVVDGVTSPDGRFAWSYGDPLMAQVDASGRVVHVVTTGGGGVI